MRASTAYFSGVGTVVAALALGLGGGMIIANTVSPHEPKPEVSRLAHRMSAEPIPASPEASEPVRHVAATQAAETIKPAAEAPASPSQQDASLPQPAPTAQPAQAVTARETNAQPATSSDDANAKARDADVKRAASDRRRAERRQRWAERHHQRRQDDDLRDAEQIVREQTAAPRFLPPEPARTGTPRIGLFDASDD